MPICVINRYDYLFEYYKGMAQSQKLVKSIISLEIMNVVHLIIINIL